MRRAMIVAFFAALFVIHQVRVGRELSEHGDDELVRQIQRIRERRGF